MRQEILLNENWRFHKGDIPVPRPADKGPVYIQSKVERKKIGPAAYHYHDKPDEFSSSGEIKSEGWVFCQLPHDYIIDRDINGNEIKRADQVARCGNAVCPAVAEALTRANLPEYCMMVIPDMAHLHDVMTS